MNSKLSQDSQVNIEYGRLFWGDTPCIILLMAQDMQGDKKWKPIGTAFPVMLNGLNLITAAHVVKNLSGKLLKAISNGLEISLQDCQIKFLLNLDIAVIQSDSDILNKLFNPCRVIEPEDKQYSSDSLISSMYQVYGYPSSKNKYSRNESFIPQPFRLSLGSGRQSPKSSNLTKLNISLLHFELDPNNLMDELYKKTNRLMQFEGFSGGPVICTSLETRLGTLIGMFLEWDKQSKIATVLPWNIISRYISEHA